MHARHMPCCVRPAHVCSRPHGHCDQQIFRSACTAGTLAQCGKIQKCQPTTHRTHCQPHTLLQTDPTAKHKQTQLRTTIRSHCRPQTDATAGHKRCCCQCTLCAAALTAPPMLSWQGQAERVGPYMYLAWPPAAAVPGAMSCFLNDATGGECTARPADSVQ